MTASTIRLIAPPPVVQDEVSESIVLYITGDTGWQMLSQSNGGTGENRDGGGGLSLTVSHDLCPRPLDKLKRLLVQLRQLSQILISTLLGKRNHALVAVVEVGEQNRSSCPSTHSSACLTQQIHIPKANAVNKVSPHPTAQTYRSGIPGHRIPVRMLSAETRITGQQASSDSPTTSQGSQQCLATLRTHQHAVLFGI